MPSNKYLKEGRKLESRGHSSPDTKWKIWFWSNPTVCVESIGDTAYIAVTRLNRLMSEIFEIQSECVISHTKGNHEEMALDNASTVVRNGMRNGVRKTGTESEATLLSG